MKTKQKKHKNTYNLLFLTLIVSVISIFSVLASGNLTGNAINVSASMLQTRIVQAKLYEMGYYDDAINGVYNQKTKEAVKNFQLANSIVASGNVDQATATALGVSASEQTNSDIYLLAKLIFSEARGEIYTGQVAVGAVVLNRVKSPGFPNTLQGVIYQPWAFTALHDGQFGMEPNATAYQAAQDAMNGWDPSYGSLYYYNPATATSSWIFTRTTIVVIGNHVFAI